MMSIARNRLFTLASVLVLSGCVNAAKQVSREVGADPAASPTKLAAAATCPAPNALGPAYDAAIEIGDVDARLLDAAILHYTNLTRCAKGVPPVSADSGLQRTARLHSDDMVRLNFFGHDSPVPGRTKLVDRLRGDKVPFKAAAENLLSRSRLQLVSGKRFTVIDGPTCTFAYDGEPIQPHSYRSLAEQFVREWERSPLHRRNLLNNRYTRLGTGGTFKDNPENCGDIVVTQNFAA